ncbi:MAG: hypothetical protein ACRD3W_24230 [Terriglobales bacterium]
MTLQLGDIAPNFEVDTTEGRIRFHEWLGQFLGLTIFSPEGFNASQHDPSLAMARIQPEFDNCGARSSVLAWTHQQGQVFGATNVEQVLAERPHRTV